jgi:hypothetical protein
MNALASPSATTRGASRRLLVALWLVAWLVYAGYFQAQWVFGERPIYFVTGDEPHYLVVATSLLRDHDLDVLDNYQFLDYFSFYPYHLGDPRDPMDMHALYGRGGHLYSKHGLGLSLLVLPGLALGGVGTAKLLMMGLTALLAAQAYQLTREVTGRPGVSFAAWLAVAFTPPLLLYADQIYPEVPGALMAVLALRAAVAPRLTPGRALVAGLALGALPWFHLRYVPIAAALALALALRAIADLQAGAERPTWRRFAQSRLWVAALPALVAGLALLAFDWHLFGGVPSVDEYGTVSPANLLAGVCGLLLDQQFGLLVYSPVLVLALAGLGLVPRLGWVRGTALLGCLGVYFLFIAVFSFWYGAFSPPARMLVPVVPILAVPLALALAHWRTVWLRALYTALLALSWGIGHLLVDVPRLRYNLPDGQSLMLLYLRPIWGHDFTTWLPSFAAPDSHAYTLTLWWALGAALILWLATRTAPLGPRLSPWERPPKAGEGTLRLRAFGLRRERSPHPSPLPEGEGERAATAW